MLLRTGSLFFIPVLAAAAPAGQDVPLPKVEIKAQAGAYDARRDDTASKVVLTHEEIVRHGDGNVFEVLKRVPGVTIAGAAGRGAEIRMRGLGNGYTQVLLNGEKVPAGFSIESLAPDAIERIEVMRVATAEYSTQAIAGTVNIILKKTVKAASAELKLSAGAGEGGGWSPRLVWQLADRRDRFSYTVSANVYRNNFLARDSAIVETGAAPDGAPSLRRDSRFGDAGHRDGLSVSPRLNWTFGSGDTLTSQTYVNLNRFARNSQLAVATSLGAPPDYPRVDEQLAWGNQFLRSELNWVAKLSADAKIDVKLGGSYGKLQHDQRQRGYRDNAGAAVLDDFVQGRGQERGLSVTGKYSLRLGAQHRLDAGWDGGRSGRDDTRFEPGAAFDEDLERYGARVRRMAVYVQDDWTVTPGWSVYLGARWEGVATDVTGSTFAPHRSDTSVWSPLFQTLVKLPGGKGDQVRLALSKTYNPPSLNNLMPRRFSTANNSPVELDFEGNPLLRPELALGLDAAYEHYWAGGALVSVSLSSRAIRDFVRSHTYFSTEGRWVAHPVNDGAARTYGLELETKFPLKTVIDGAPDVDFRASLSRNWSAVDAVPGPYNRIDQQTPLSFNTGIDYKRGALALGGSFAFRNGGLARQSLAQTVYNSVRRELDVYVMWNVDARNRLRCYFSNVLAQDSVIDRSYADGQGMQRRNAHFASKANVRLTWEVQL